MLHQLLKLFFFFFNDTATTEIYTLSLHDALPISFRIGNDLLMNVAVRAADVDVRAGIVRHQRRILATPQPGEILRWLRSEEHTSELQSRSDLVCRLLLEKKKKKYKTSHACAGSYV